MNTSHQMTKIYLQPNQNNGTAISPADESALSLDALLTTNCRLSFPKLPHVQFWLQSVSLPAIRVNEVKQYTRYVDPNQIGEKLNFDSYRVTFTVDKYMKNWSSIFNWMKQMTAGGSSVDITDNPVLIINGIEMLRFVGAWPMILGGLDFVATASDAMNMISSLEINYDYIDLLQNKTIDSIYK